MGPAAVSTGALARLVDRPYWDLEAAVQAALLLKTPPLELVLLPEWDPVAPPVTPYHCRWEESRGRCTDAVLELIAGAGLEVVSVHASRDVGKLLSLGEHQVLRAHRQLREAVATARDAGASHVVLHAWDTFATDLNAAVLAGRLAAAFPGGDPGIPLAIEGIPVSARGWNPCSLARAAADELSRRIPDATMAATVVDLEWCALFGDFGEWVKPASGSPRPPLLNIHVQGSVTGGTGVVAPTRGNLDYTEALWRLRALHPAAQLTLEIKGPSSLADVRAALSWLAAGPGGPGSAVRPGPAVGPDYRECCPGDKA